MDYQRRLSSSQRLALNTPNARNALLLSFLTIGALALREATSNALGARFQRSTTGPVNTIQIGMRKAITAFELRIPQLLLRTFVVTATDPDIRDAASSTCATAFTATKKQTRNNEP